MPEVTSRLCGGTDGDQANLQRKGTCQHFLRLPEEIIQHVFSFLDIDSKIKHRSVSKQWKRHLDKPELYRTLHIETRHLWAESERKCKMAVYGTNRHHQQIFRNLQDWGMFAHVQRLVIHGHLKFTMEDSVEAYFERASRLPYYFFQHYAELINNSNIEEICLSQVRVDIRGLSSNMLNWCRYPWIAKCRTKLLHVELLFERRNQQGITFLGMPCESLTINPAVETEVSCAFFGIEYVYPRTLHEYLQNQIRPLNHQEAEALKGVHRDLAKGRPNCQRRPDSIGLLRELGYYRPSKKGPRPGNHIRDHEVPRRKFDIEKLDKFDQFALAYFSKHRNYFMLDRSTGS